MLPGERECDVLLEQMLVKQYKYHNTDNGRHSGLSVFSSCLNQGFYSCINIMIKKHVEDERVYSAYTCTLPLITKGSQNMNSHNAGALRQELLQRPWRDVPYCFFQLAFL